MHMKRALALARRGAGWASPNPMVGAVVLDAAGQVVGEGWHRAHGLPHAEAEALAAAGDRARGGSLYVTLEPCNHHGKTPPCTEAVLRAGVARVVCAMEDPNPAVAGGGLARLRAGGVETGCGLLEDRARALNESWLCWLSTGRPLVIAKAASTLDGRIATRTGDSRWVTGEKARAWVHRLRHGTDAILVGRGTVLADDPRLTARLPGGRKSRDPLRVVLDTRLATPPGAAMLRGDSDSGTLIICGPDAPEARREALLTAGARVESVPLNQGRLDLPAVLDLLGRLKVTGVLVEGGGQVLASFLAAGLVDRMHLFLAPKFLGGDDGVPLFSGAGPEKMAGCTRLSGVSVRRLGEDILVTGRPEKPGV